MKKEIKDLLELENILSFDIESKDIKRVSFMIYHIIKQCPYIYRYQVVKSRNYAETFQRLYNAGWNGEEVIQCVRKIDELILRDYDI